MSFLKTIDYQLEAMEKGPQTWGSWESVELQYLLLLEMKISYLFSIKNPDKDCEKVVSEVFSNYIRFIFQEMKMPSNLPLNVILAKSNKENELPVYLAKFRNQQEKHFEYLV